MSAPIRDHDSRCRSDPDISRSRVTSSVHTHDRGFPCCRRKGVVSARSLVPSYTASEPCVTSLPRYPLHVDLFTFLRPHLPYPPNCLPPYLPLHPPPSLPRQALTSRPRRTIAAARPANCHVGVGRMQYRSQMGLFRMGQLHMAPKTAQDTGSIARALPREVACAGSNSRDTGKHAWRPGSADKRTRWVFYDSSPDVLGRQERNTRKGQDGGKERKKSERSCEAEASEQAKTEREETKVVLLIHDLLHSDRHRLLPVAPSRSAVSPGILSRRLEAVGGGGVFYFIYFIYCLSFDVCSRLPQNPTIALQPAPLLRSTA